MTGIPADPIYLSRMYEYACLLAFDASPGGTLHQSWESLPATVKRGFWEGANVYSMILRTNAGETAP
jgi:hypothetical protein